MERNRAILSLAYKLIDNYPNLTLFGGVVRDVIAPAFFKGKYPFEKAFQTDVEISDLDVLIKVEDIDREENIQHVFRVYVYSTLQSPMRAWDWQIKNVTDLNVYGVLGVRINISHQLLDLDIHIDLIDHRGSNINRDADVNQLRFNKEEGLFLSNYSKRLNISSHFRYQAKLLEMEEKLDQKVCRMVCNPQSPTEPQLTVLRMRRLVKMIRKGWTIENISPQIQVHEVNPGTCMICYEQQGQKAIEFTCSKCMMCVGCFESLLEQHVPREGKVKCPTCRIFIEPWTL